MTVKRRNNFLLRLLMISIFLLSLVSIYLYRVELLNLLSREAIANMVLFGILLIDVLLFGFLYGQKIVKAQGEQIVENVSKLKESESRLSQIVNGLPIPVFVIDNDHQITHWNDACEALTGKKRGQMLGTSKQWMAFYAEQSPVLADILVDEEWRVQSFYNGKVKKSPLVKGGYTMEDFFPSLGQSGKWINFSAAPIKNPYGSVIGAVETLADTTTEREVERMKAEFLSIAAHQLRTPLGAMRWSVDMLSHGELGRMPKTAKETLEKLSENTNRMIALVDDLLNVSRLEQGKVENAVEETDVLAITKAAVSELESEAAKQNVHLRVSAEVKTLNVFVDQKRFREVVENLLSNAVKYNRPGGQVTVRFKKERRQVVMEVADTGFGIPDADQSQIFTKFFRAGNAVKSQADGSGLGLFVVKSYVEQWKGTIKFVSQENQGTTFTVTIPLHGSYAVKKS